MDSSRSHSHGQDGTETFNPAHIWAFKRFMACLPIEPSDEQPGPLKVTMDALREKPTEERTDLMGVYLRANLGDTYSEFERAWKAVDHKGPRPGPVDSGESQDRSQGESQGGDWPALRLKAMPETKPFPLGVFPAPLAEYARQASRAYASPVDFAAASILTAVSAAIGQTQKLRLKSTWHEPCPLFTVIVAPKGRDKSHVVEEPLKALISHDERLLKRSADEKTAWEQRRDEAKANKTEFTECEPTRKQLLISDITRESLAAELHANPRGLLIWRDEVSGWFKSFNEYKGGGADEEFWLTLWNGKLLKVNRRTGSFVVMNPFVSLIGGIQPKVLAELKTGRDNGLIDRIAFVYPDPSAWPCGEWDDCSEIQPDVLATWERVVHRLLSVEQYADEETGNPRSWGIPMSLEADREWAKNYNRMKAAIRDPYGDEDHQGALAKLLSMLARFTLILSRMRLAMLPPSPDRADPLLGAVEPQDVQGAARLIEYFESMWSRARYTMDGQVGGGIAGIKSPDTERLTKWILRHQLEKFTLRDAKRDLKVTMDEDQVLTAIGDLEKAGVLRKVKVSGKAGPGRKASPSWEVNPQFNCHNGQYRQNGPGTDHSDPYFGDTGDIVNKIQSENEEYNGEEY